MKVEGINDVLVVDGVEQVYSDKEIKLEVEKNSEMIMKFIKKVERTYADGGLLNYYERIKVYFDIDTGDLCELRPEQGFSIEKVEKFKRGIIVEVSDIESGSLRDMAEEGVISSTDAEKGSDEFEGMVRDYVSSHIEDCSDICLITNLERYEMRLLMGY